MPFAFAVFPYGQAEKSQDIRLTVKVLVEKTYASGAFTEVRAQTFYPDADGLISLDIHTILDPYLSYYLPKLNLAKAVLASGQRKRYKIACQLIKDGENAGVEAESAMLHVIKGGLAYEQWHPTEFFTKVIGQQRQPLRYNTPVQKVFADEIHFLFWLYNAQPEVLVLEDGSYVDEGSGNSIVINENTTFPLRVIFTVYDNTGAQYAYTLPGPLTSDKWSIGCAPVGFNQAGLQALVPLGNYAVSYTVEVTSDAGQVIDPVTFVLDYRNFYRTCTLLYRNSVGGTETLTLRGQVDATADYDRQQAQRSVPPDYFQNLTVLPQLTDNVSEESAKFKGDTGFISRKAADKLRDLFLSPQKFELVNGSLQPIIINTKSTTFYTNRDSLISTQIEWQCAFTNRFFTPQLLMPTAQARACPAVESFEVTAISRERILIMYALQIPYDQIQVQIKAKIFRYLQIVGTGTGLPPGGGVTLPGGIGGGIILPPGVGSPGTLPGGIVSGSGILAGRVYTYVYTGNAASVLQQINVPDILIFRELEITARTICDADSDPMSMGPSAVITIPLIAKQPPVVADNSFTIDAGHTAYVLLPGSVLADDYDPDGNPIEAVPYGGGTSAGGFYIIYADGTVNYLPPSATFAGADYFDYQVREVGGTEMVTGRVFINVVAVTATVVSVFAKLVYRNVVETSNFDGKYKKGEIWIDVFTDPAGTMPATVAGLIVNTEIKVHQVSHNNITINKTTNTPYTITGTQIKIHDGPISTFEFPGTFQYSFQYQRDTKLLPGTGYIII